MTTATASAQDLIDRILADEQYGPVYRGEARAVHAAGGKPKAYALLREALRVSGALGPVISEVIDDSPLMAKVKGSNQSHAGRAGVDPSIGSDAPVSDKVIPETKVKAARKKRERDPAVENDPLNAPNEVEVETPVDEVEMRPNRVDRPDLRGHTDMDNVGRFIDLFGGQLIYTRTAGWMRFDGTRWVLGNEFATRGANAVTEKMLADAVIDPRLTTDQKTKLAKAATDSRSGGRLHTMVGLAQDFAPFTTDETGLDRDPLLLNVRNGTIDLSTGKLRPHDRRDLITKIGGCDFDPDAESDLWDRVLAEATAGQEGLAEFLQRAAGYTLTGYTKEDAVFFFKGPGGTAKSTIAEAFKAVMGNYAVGLRSEALTVQGNSGHNDDIARLAGARLAITGEADKAEKMRDGLLKKMSGGDTISASLKGKTGFDFQPMFKVWFITNNVPALNPNDSAIWRRVYKLPFEHVVLNPDRQIRLDLQQKPEHQRAILAWAVRGAVEWYRTGLQAPQSVLEATEAMRRDMDGLADAIDDVYYFNLDPKANLFSSNEELMVAYLKWCAEEGIRYPVSKKTLGQALEVRGAVSTVRNSTTRGRRGVIVKDEWQ
jgi:putative DNA primase/helicase